MATIVTRSGKGSPLTNTEVDANFTNLNTELGTKANTSSLAAVATSGAYSDLTGKPTNVSSFANDSGYITSSALSAYQPLDGDLTAIAALAGTTGFVKKTAANTYTLDTATYLTGITSGQVTTALGFTPYNATNPSGYITGITSGNVTTALGYTPYNATNPAGYITSSALSPYALLSGAAFTGNVSTTSAVGIGIANPAARLHLNFGDQADARIRIQNTGVSGRAYDLVSGITNISQTGFSIYDASAGATRLVIDASGSVTASVDVRAPIFYDTNDTSYYLDPNGTSVLNAINPWGEVGMRRGDSGTLLRSYNTAAGQPVQFYVNHNLGNVEIGNARGPVFAGGDYWQIAGSTRSPIFYDSNDTAFYADPASTSNFNQINLGDSTKFIRGGGSGQTILGVGGVNEAYLQVGGSYYSIWNAGNFNPASYLPLSGGTLTGNLILANGANRIVRIGSATNYSYDLQTVGDNFQIIEAGTTPRLTISYPSGAVTASTDFRAPIFYDSNNTGYYFDGAGTSVANVVSIIGGLAVSDNNNDPYGKLAVTRATGSNFTYYGLTRSGQMVYGMGIDTSNNYWIGGSTAGADGVRSGTPYLSLNTSGQITASGDFRAPVFYDSNNTGFYLDPNATSNVSAMVSYSYQGNGNVGGTGSASWHPSGIYSAGYNWLYGGISAGGGDITSVNAVYANVYYDSNDTAYYLDASSAGTALSTNGVLIAGSGTNGGVLNRTYVAGRNSIWSFANASSYGLSYFQGGPDYIGLHPSGTATQAGSDFWVSSSGTAQARSDMRAPLFYDSNNTAYYVDPASTSRFGNIQSIDGELWLPNFSNIRFGGTSFGAGVCTIEGALGDGLYFYPTGNTHGIEFYMGGTFCQAYTAFRSPIFQDSANTAFYLDPNATGTSLNVAGSIVAAGNVTAYSDIRIKANVETIPSALDKLDQIRGVTYTRTDLDDKEQRYAGVIAQEIEAVLPEAVRDMGNIKAVDYNATIALLIQAVKELRDEVEMLRK